MPRAAVVEAAETEELDDDREFVTFDAQGYSRDINEYLAVVRTIVEFDPHDSWAKLDDLFDLIGAAGRLGAFIAESFGPHDAETPAGGGRYQDWDIAPVLAFSADGTATLTFEA